MGFFRKKGTQGLLIVGICGRSCSGKGALTEALASINWRGAVHYDDR